jgi:hypothetical protein
MVRQRPASHHLQLESATQSVHVAYEHAADTSVNVLMFNSSANQCFSSIAFGARYRVKVKDSIKIKTKLIAANDLFESLVKFFIKSLIL